MFSFEGRSTRSEFLGIIVADVVFGAVVYGAYAWIGSHLGGLRAVPTEIAAVVLFVFCALVVPLAVATAASSVKRFHDRGKSGWWALSVFVVIGLIEGLLAKGDEGKNAYGAALVVSKATPVASPAKSPAASTPKSQAPVPPKPAPAQMPTQGESSPIKGQAIPPIQTMPQSPASPSVAPAPQAPVPPKPFTPPTPVAQAPTAPVTPAPATPQASAPVSPQIPPARSMSEMLAELQKLAAKENAMAAKPPVKPATAPQAAAPAQGTPASSSVKVTTTTSPAPATSAPQAQAPAKAAPTPQATL